VHDATYASHDDRENAILYGHSLFREAAELAASAAAQRLWLTHFSQTIVSPKDALPEAQAVFPAAECGYDGKRVTLRYAEA
jgi:ribonuclease Z